MKKLNRNSTVNNERSQFSLLASRRFAPFFWTQFFGAFNDNVFRNALFLLIAFKSTQMVAGRSDIFINIAAGLFILPFFLFSATAGQIADKFEKGRLIRIIKLVEILIMISAAVAFYLNNLVILLLLLFLMGTQSAFFGPVKYSIIPQHLKHNEIIGGNAMVEMGTFVSILLGTITGGVLSQLDRGVLMIGTTLCMVAVVGWLASRYIPVASPASSGLKINFNPVTQTLKTIRLAQKERSVFLSILGISWFWFLGVAYLTQLPNFTKEVLKSSESVVTMLLAMFSIGVGIGSLLCERLSGRKVEIGLVPLGSIGLSLFGFDLFLSYTPPIVENLMGIRQFLSTPGSFRVIADLILIGLFGGFYIVPLFALIQVRSKTEIRARIIAANNILNALFMVFSSIAAVLLIGFAKLSIPLFFLILSIANAAVAIYIYFLVPEFTMRFLIWILTHTMYRVKHIDLNTIPDEGPAVLVCNHVSYIDGLIIAGACRRPVRFVIYKPIYRLPVLHFIFRTGKAIPIVSQKEDLEAFENAFKEISLALDDGELVCIFPEGSLTKDGKIDKFRPGIEKIIKRNPVPVIPLALRGLWGSFFSHKDGKALSRSPKRFWSKIVLVGGKPVSPDMASANNLFNIVKALKNGDSDKKDN